MKPTRKLLKTNSQRYALAGVSFGFFFPILATVIRIVEAGLPLSLTSILAVHAADPLLWIIDTAPFLLGFFAYLAGRRQDDLEQTNHTLRLKEQELQSTQLAMEQQISDRTQDLISRNQAIMARAELFNSIVDTSHSLLTTQEINRLLPIIVQVISRHFKYDHVGIFLLDEQKQNAVLVASSSEGGVRIMQRGLRLRLREHSPVEHAIRSGQPYIIDDTSKEPLFQREAELADTRSELLLPLKSGPVVIGVLDLQAYEPRLFNEEYISILSILSDLVAVAIQNATLNEKTKEALKAVEANSQKTLAKLWGTWLESTKARGYRYDGIRSERVKAVEVSAPTGSNTQSIPLSLRGRTIGNIRIRLSEASQTWTEDDQAIASATAERAALALEGARLLDDAKRRAAREAFLAEMATKLSGSFRLDSILRDTVEELGQRLEASTVSFQLVNPTTPSPVANTNPWDLPPSSPMNTD